MSVLHHDIHIFYKKYIFIQETYSSEENEKQWTNEWGGHITFSHGTKHSKGSAILIKKVETYQLLMPKMIWLGDIII